MAIVWSEHAETDLDPDGPPARYELGYFPRLAPDYPWTIYRRDEGGHGVTIVAADNPREALQVWCIHFLA